MRKKAFKIILILCIIILLFLLFLLLLIKNDNDNKEAKIKVENFCNTVKVGFNLPDYRNIDSKKIVYSDEKFFEYDEKMFNTTAICMVELKDGKVISKNFKYLH